MLSLYNEKPISISINSKNKIKVEFCNIKMNLNPCQFRIFHNYLSGVSKNLNGSKSQVELLLVREELRVIISLSEFLQLCNAVQSVMAEKFGLRSPIVN